MLKIKKGVIELSMLQVKQEFMVACITLYQYLINRGNITANEQAFIDALAETHFINKAHISAYNDLHPQEGENT